MNISFLEPYLISKQNLISIILDKGVLINELNHTVSFPENLDYYSYVLSEENNYVIRGTKGILWKVKDFQIRQEVNRINTHLLIANLDYDIKDFFLAEINERFQITYEYPNSVYKFCDRL